MFLVWDRSVGGGKAADWGALDLLSSHSSLYRPDRWEVRGGGFAQCCFVGKGFTLGAEVVAPRLFLIPHLPEFFSPRFHFGGQVNIAGHTSYAYGGLLFTYNLTQRIFLEPFVGIAFADGSAAGDAKHQPNRLHDVIHSGGNIGLRFDQHWSFMLTLDHISNGNLCSRNVGVNNYGGKIGYSF